MTIEGGDPVLRKMKHVDSLMLIHRLAQQQFVRKPVRVFGLKVMDKHVGVAISDLDTLRAKSYCVLETKDSNILAQSFQRLMRKESVEGLVVGQPYPEGAKNPQDPNANLVEKFVEDLSKTGKLNDVPYTLWDDSWAVLELMECLFLPFRMDPLMKRRMMHRACTRGATEVLQDYLHKVGKSVNLRRRR
ncbi:hypothetical protein CTI12_AA524020 [Artemisia annua]|uniref:Uncharacterized protein n=1 Tax=Artemisia annua TaxID=35608 RepID=A0A2U1L6U8_ARTAN|nr:hypothetical protein CTI12_AA524020 [Artemisia annua]